MAYKFNKITVLIVEDTQEMFEITRAVLQTFGINSTISANDLRSGWRKFCNYNPDLVIIDWLENGSLEDQGAIADGLKLMHAIRHDDKSPNKFVPAIMMTGYSIKRNINLARDYGATEFIAKPFTAETLYRRMEHIIEHPRRFVRAPGFFGPDRRRREDNPPQFDRRAAEIDFEPSKEKL